MSLRKNVSFWIFLICWVFSSLLYIVFLDSSLGLKKYEELPDGFYHLPQSHCGVWGKGSSQWWSKTWRRHQLPKFCSLHESVLYQDSIIVHVCWIADLLEKMNIYKSIHYILIYLQSSTTNRKPCLSPLVRDYPPLDSHTIAIVP